jgi:diacylglycerol kinase (ATP)
MKPSRFLIVTNPASGRGRASSTIETVLGHLRRAGSSAEICETAQKGQAESAIRDACRAVTPPDVVVACGGDGTVQEVAATLAVIRREMGDACPSMGLAPAGRCNDFARAMGITPDADAIAGALLRGQPQFVDLGRANGRYFCTVAALGVDADVSSYVDAMQLPLRGTPAYVVGALKVLAQYKPRWMRIEGEFGVIERELFMASTANTPVYGGNMRIVPHADPADGVLDLCLIDPVSRLKAFTLLPKVMAGRHVDLPIVQFLRSRHLKIAAEPQMEMWADGERLTQTTVSIEVVPNAIRVLKPATP